MRNRVCRIGMAAALLVSGGSHAFAQSWPPKAEMESFARPFVGKTYIFDGPGIRDHLVYVAPGERAYVVEGKSVKVIKGSWEVTYSSSRRSKGFCFRGRGRGTCLTEQSMRRIASRQGDGFGLSRLSKLPSEPPFRFGFSDVDAAFKPGR